MTSINFDYFVERGTILTEMARLATLSGVKNPPPALVKAYAELRTVLGKKYGYDRSSSIDCIVFSFIYQELSNDTSPEHNALWRSAKKNCPQRKNAALSILDDLNSKGYDFTELISAMHDEDKVNGFVESWQNSDGSRNKGIENVLSKAGSSRKEYMQLASELKPIIAQMMREMGWRKTSRTRRGEKSKYFKIPSSTPKESDNQESFELKSDPNFANTELVLDAIELLESYNDTVSSTIKQIKQLYQQRLDDGKPISREKFLSHMVKNISSIPNANIKSELIDLVKLFKELESDIAEIEDPDTEMGSIALMINNMNMSDSVTSSDLPENISIDNDILLKYLKDSDILNKFKLLLNLKKELDQDYASKKLEKIKMATEFEPDVTKSSSGNQQTIIFAKEKEIEQKQASGEDVSKDLIDLSKMKKRLEYIDSAASSNTPQVKSANQLGGQLKALNRQLELLQNDLSKAVDEEDKAPIQRKIDGLEKLYDKLTGDLMDAKERESTMSESVLSYMEEQVFRDNKFGSQKGQFVDRGFKKFKNYNHWFNANE